MLYNNLSFFIDEGFGSLILYHCLGTRFLCYKKKCGGKVVTTSEQVDTTSEQVDVDVELM
jgi:hypothetical protein